MDGIIQYGENMIETFDRTHPILFAKFGEYKHLQELQKGDFFCGSSQYYRELEKRTMQRGKGDRFEGCKILKNVDVDIGGIKIPNVEELLISKEIDDRTPIFCYSWYSKENFKKISNRKYQLNFESSVWDTMKEQFGQYVLVVFNVVEFASLLRKYFESQGVNVCILPVKYFDYSSEKHEWYTEYSKGDMQLFFIKDIFFRTQYEARIVFDGMLLDKDKRQIRIETGIDFSDISRIMSVEQLKDMYIKI